MRGRSPTQERPFPAGQDGGQVPGLEAGRSVTHAIHAAMLGKQGARPQALPDLPGGDARAGQLRAGNHPMRGAGYPCDHGLDRPAVLLHRSS